MKKILFLPFYITFYLILTYSKILKLFGSNDYIKIDVDGHEKEILKGMEKIFQNQKIKSVIIEVEKKNREDIESFFKKNNFHQNMDMFSENDDNLIYDRNRLYD